VNQSAIKIVVAEKMAAAGLRLLDDEAARDGWCVVPPETFAEDPAAHLRDAIALIVRSAVRADRKLLEGAPRLRVIGRAGAGVDNVDVDFATERGIVVMNTPGANAIAVAEHTLGLMLAMARHLPRADHSTRAGRWEKKSLQGTELKSKVLGIVGLGRVGAEVARRALALEMTVLAFDPYVAAARAEELGAKPASLDEVFSNADYLSLHVGLSPQTEKMINAGAIQKMKSGVRIVNCARGELIDDAALAAALASGQIAGAALDVFAQEPPAGSELLKSPNVIATPHIAGSTDEAQEAVSVQIVQQVVEYLRESVAQNAVNAPSVSDAEYRQMRPYLQLAEKLASLLGQLSEGNLAEVRLSYGGALGRWKTALIRKYALIGLLGKRSQEIVNLVNADGQARQRGIRVSENNESAANIDLNLLSIALRAERTSLSATGAVVHGSSARIIELNGAEIEAPLEGHMLLIRNLDVPGVIGKVGSLLGAGGVNIARFALGRESAPIGETLTFPGQRKALGLIQTDVAVPRTILDELQRLPEIVSIKAVVL
jgi:D-3-phosphoglycerate dehydrogenase